ncbi:unnamed protein product [Kuraishia capsulata CBS 1993]|uniref:Uncharacterized protein n=1 Tax=Kuraishia capsulata CBS 1993 TaxID=1382522 RepID=W6MQG9_9ASCO|nr:uncharacterized protein KUCA_T00004546001 [Kuraishia capsulata CBS 1993]CDK28563.1 unnamed protein product [Kuraishia capsulata CBS 1993]
MTFRGPPIPRRFPVYLPVYRAGGVYGISLRAEYLNSNGFGTQTPNQPHLRRYASDALSEMKNSQYSFRKANEMLENGEVPSVEVYEELVGSCYDTGAKASMARVALQLTVEMMKRYPDYKLKPSFLQGLSSLVSRSSSFVDQMIFFNLLKQTGTKQLWAYAGVEVSRLLNAREYEHAVRVFKSAFELCFKGGNSSNQNPELILRELRFFPVLWNAALRGDMENLEYFLEIVQVYRPEVSEKLFGTILSAMWENFDEAEGVAKKVFLLCEDRTIPIQLSQSSLLHIGGIISKNFDVELTQQVVRKLMRLRETTKLDTDLASLTLDSYCNHSVADHLTIWKVLEQFMKTGVDLNNDHTYEMARSYGLLNKKSRISTLAKDLEKIDDTRAQSLILHSVVTAVANTTNFTGVVWLLSELDPNLLKLIDRETWDLIVRAAEKSNSAKLCAMTLHSYYKRRGFQISPKNYASFIASQTLGTDYTKVSALIHEYVHTYGKVPTKVVDLIRRSSDEKTSSVLEGLGEVTLENLHDLDAILESRSALQEAHRIYHQEYDERDNERLKLLLTI